MKKRELILKFRLSKEEANKIFTVQKKTYLSKSEFCRRILLGNVDSILSREDKLIRDDIRTQMSWISVNVNQIAKALNGMAKGDKPFEFTLNQMKIIENLNAMMEQWTKVKGTIL